jgi:GTP 3',8-cyclase
MDKVQAFELDGAAARRGLIDPFGRAITYLRVSVTDRCDFRCVYCMAENMSFLPKAEILSLEELDRLCSAFVARGVRKLRLTGGEPLVRRGIMTLVDSLSRHLRSGALDELTLTTNGSQLEKYARDLAAAGIRRINVSLDTLDAEKFRAITRWGSLDRVLAGIDAATAAGLKIKINTVALKDVNDDEFPRLIEWAHGRGMDLTLIEVMPLGEIGEGRLDQYLPLSPNRPRRSNRRTRTLCAHRGNRRTARLHHPADAQFLRILQSRARHLHRHAVYVPRPGGRRRPAQAVARI